MIIKCPNCSSALEFDPESGKLFCNACCSYFEAGDLQTEDSDIFENHNDNFDAEEAFKKAINTDSFESFETNIYICANHVELKFRLMEWRLQPFALIAVNRR